MKWIGQHIWDYISRFRNDVYLEDISTGTIASGGNLGLDSNNKIVKANTEAGELTIANASDNRIVTSLGGTDLNAEANLTFNGSVFAMSSITATISDSSVGPIFTIQNTGNNSYGGGLVLENTRGGNDASDSDTLGIISFAGKDDGVPSNTYYGDIVCTATDVTSDQEKGEMKLRVASYDGVRENGLLLAGTTTDGEVDVTIGAGAASTTTIAGTLTMGSTAFVNNSGVVQVATQGTIDHDSLANFVANEHIDWTGDVSASSVIHTNNITDLHGAGVDGSADQLLTDNGNGTVTSESSLTYNTTFGTALIMASSLPQIAIRNTNNDANGASVTLSNFRGTSLSALSDNDILGNIIFNGADSLGNLTNYAQIKGDVNESNNNDEAGRLYLQVAANSTLRTGIQLTGDDGDNEVDVSVGYGAASITTINGHLLVEGVTQFNGQLEIGNASDTTLVRSSGGTLTVEGNTVATTNLALDSFADSTSNSIGVGNIELGHASDTTIARSAAGKATIEGNEIITTATQGRRYLTATHTLSSADVYGLNSGSGYVIVADSDVASGEVLVVHDLLTSVTTPNYTTTGVENIALIQLQFGGTSNAGGYNKGTSFQALQSRWFYRQAANTTMIYRVMLQENTIFGSNGGSIEGGLGLRMWTDNDPTGSAGTATESITAAKIYCIYSILTI